MNDSYLFSSLEKKVKEWAKDRGILDKATPLKQAVKTQEEVTELINAIIDNNREEIVDAIGDILVTIIIQAKMQNLEVENCLMSAYNVISKRKGKMINGMFVKEE